MLENHLSSDRSVERPFLLQRASTQVWVQAVGRLLYQGGYGAIHFFMPLVFVNQVHLSATAVGVALGCGSLAGILGHLLGGYLADSPAYGRKRALIFSAILSLVAAVILLKTQTLGLLIFVNLVLGVSAGCYWTAADATVVDVTPSEERQKAFAILVLADSLGLALSIGGGGWLLKIYPQRLFLAGVGVLLLFLVLILFAVRETHSASDHQETLQGFAVAIKDRALQLFFLVNVVFATYAAVISDTLPLYFANRVGADLSLSGVSNLFTWWYVGLGAVIQFPLVQLVSSLRQVSVLMMSMVLWAVGFLLVWMTQTPISMAVSLVMLSVAGAAYKPFAPAVVSELAPPSLRGIYLAISYQCWSIGYFIGPLIGGWALDRPNSIAHNAWLVAAASTVGGLLLLGVLSRQELDRTPEPVQEVPVLDRSS